jgi:hypothetical protein
MGQAVRPGASAAGGFTNQGGTLELAQGCGEDVGSREARTVGGGLYERQ